MGFWQFLHLILELFTTCFLKHWSWKRENKSCKFDHNWTLEEGLAQLVSAFCAGGPDFDFLGETTNPSFDIFAFRVALSSFKKPIKWSADVTRGGDSNESTVGLRFVCQMS